eukprot:gene2661-2700_t
MHHESRTFQGLARLKDKGFLPPAILDVGAYNGDWTRGVRTLYPDSFILMVEAMAEKAPLLGAVCRDIGNANYIISLIGSEDTDGAAFYVPNAANESGPVQTGSSRYREASSVMIEERTLPQRTIDSILLGDLREFKLLKLDIQGGELDALRGAKGSLANVDVIMTEASLLPYNQGAPLIGELLATAGEMGFVLSDVGDEHRHFADQSMVQLDLILTRTTSPLRRQPPYF